MEDKEIDGNGIDTELGKELGKALAEKDLRIIKLERQLKNAEKSIISLENALKRVYENSKCDDENKNRPMFANCTIHAQEMNFK